MSLSTDYIKAVTGKFDTNTIFCLNVSSKKIKNVTALNNCANLLVLNISYNNISSINELNNLKMLIMLDISYNDISDINIIKEFKMLKTLKAQGNRINSLDNIHILSSLDSIQKIYFQEVSGNASNPICKIDNYRLKVFKNCQKLKVLDGTPQGFSLIDQYKNTLNIISNNSEDNITDKFDFDYKSKLL